MIAAADAIDRRLTRLPERVLEACSPDEVLRVEHGIALDESVCPSCGEIYTAERITSSRCVCGRPLDRRCDHRDEAGRRDCFGMATPERHRGMWYEADGLCSACRERGARELKRAHIEAVFRTAAKELQFARDYGARSLPEADRRLLLAQRKPLDEALQVWFGSDCGRGRGALWVIAIGPVGVGKTVPLIRYAAAAYVGGVVDRLAYVTEDELVKAISGQWDDDENVKEASKRTVSSAADADLLVLDEAGKLGRDDLTKAQRREYPRLLKLRIDAGLPTLIAMNRELSPIGPFAYLDSRVDSRIAAEAVVVRMVGADMRRLEVSA